MIGLEPIKWLGDTALHPKEEGTTTDTVLFIVGGAAIGFVIWFIIKHEGKQRYAY